MKKVFLDVKSKNPGHYAPGIISKGMLYVSGQLPKNLDTGKIVEGGLEAQTLQALQNVERVLVAGGCTLADVVMTRVYISNMDNWDVVNKIYGEYFGEHTPARVVVPTRELHFGALIEIEAMAELPE